MDGEAISMEQAVGLLMGDMPEQDNATAEAPESEAAPEVEVSDAGEQEISPEPAGDDAQGEPETVDPEPQEEVKAEQPSIDPPHFWTAEEKAAFAKLTPEVQQIVVAKDKANQALVTKAQQERAEAVKAAEAVKLDAARIEQTLELARQKFDRWRGYDWAKVAREDPDRYVADKAAYDVELQTAQQLYQAKQQVEAKQQQAFYAEQEAKLAEYVPELADAKTGIAKRQELAQWLLDQGADPDDLANITAWQTKIAWEAMRMSRVSKSAPTATKPAAPKPVKPATVTPSQSPLKTQLDAAQAELKKTGSMAAAQKVMMLKQQIAAKT